VREAFFHGGGVAAGGTAAVSGARRRGDGRRVATRPAPNVQFFSRYPVLKIHATIANEIARKPSVIARLRPTLTSPAP
jgi:hypothetical protein